LRGTLAAPPATGNCRRSNKPDGCGPEGSIRPWPAGCPTAALKTQFGDSPVLDIALDRSTFEEHGADLAVLLDRGPQAEDILTGTQYRFCDENPRRRGGGHYVSPVRNAAAMSALVYGARGCSTISFATPCSMMRPSFITAISSATARITARS
jgi:hypothetical protein